MLSSSQERLLRWLCRIYRLMLLAYPSTFRREYSREMVVVFRTRARDVMQRDGSSALLPFMRHISLDWLHTTLRESTDMTRSMPTFRWFAALPLAMLSALAVLRLAGAFMALTARKGPPYDIRRGLLWADVGLFLMAAAFVGVGVWVAPGRKDAVARIALSVVVFGGVVAYLPWRPRETIS